MEMSSMYLCPRCHQALFRAEEAGGISWECQICGGKAMGLGLLRKTIGEIQAAQIWGRQFTGEDRDGCSCPMCTHLMKEVTVAMVPGPLTVDICQPCGFVWFDAGECEFIPPPPPPAHVLGQIDRSRMSDEQIESLALVEAQRLADEERARDPSPLEDWKTLPGLFGLPVEVEAPEEARFPWATAMTAFVIATVSITAFFNLKPTIQQYGLIPQQAWRDHGLTFLTSFFLHGSAWHLLGNLYFLIVFGRGVERDVGPWRWLLLFFAAGVMGDLLDIALDPRGDLPTIGASGGISGILAYYAFKFPEAKLAIFFRISIVYFRWVEFPAWVGFLVWIALQAVGASRQMAGQGEVASLAHLGGVAVGVIFWLTWRNPPPRSGNDPGRVNIKVQ
jgi:membrane associated rhomboid family serine protease/Zn-finger nucleic acid-binding protein